MSEDLKLSSLNKHYFVSTGDHIIKISGQTKTSYMGYDIFTEQFVEAKKEVCQTIPKFVYSLLNDQYNRITLAAALKDNNISQAIELLDIGERTTWRYINKRKEQEVNK